MKDDEGSNHLCPMQVCSHHAIMHHQSRLSFTAVPLTDTMFSYPFTIMKEVTFIIPSSTPSGFTMEPPFSAGENHLFAPSGS
jgi:hypothetical protein